MTLSDKISQIESEYPNKVKHRKEWRNEKRNGHVITDPLLLWNTLCLNRDIHFIADNTGRARGQARNWVKELRRSEYSDNEVQKVFSDIIENWRSLRGMEFISKNGYKVQVPDMPSINFAYCYRHEIMAAISKAEIKNDTQKEITFFEAF